MTINQILSLAFIMLLSTSCKSEIQKQKEQNINKNIETMKIEIDSIHPKKYKQVEKSTSLNNFDIPKPKQVNEADKIIGIWEMKNDYYMAIYEIEKYKGKFIGKVHYYNDGEMEYKGKNTKKDYFLDGVIYENGIYTNGKMYMPDGSNYQVIFKLNSNDELETKITLENEPYTETWTRQ